MTGRGGAYPATISRALWSLSDNNSRESGRKGVATWRG